MAGISSEDASAEWRSSDQVENCTPSTSPFYLDSDEDGDGRPRPSELYGKHTWKIDKYSQITKRELRSNVFEAGGYKWYILIYPQGCDVSNHLSLFLCVANHDKLLPGWSHFAQFTIAVVNKDPKKSKYSDTLHRFWKKEHDWGWKKFMELSKLQDGFIDVDNLIIKAQVQVIRERADRPFRCLDCQYRGELIRVYLTNVEQICRRFVEERRAKLGKFIEDRSRWSSFCAFWSSVDPNSRRRMSIEKMESILKVIVKHFFIEKEVTSTLVMDSMYSGLKTLENQEKGKKSKTEHSQTEDLPFSFIRIEKDSFILVDDVLQLLERAALDPLPPKDEKGPQNRMKDGSAGEEFNKDSIERDERRLTELGRQTLEIFVLGKIFSKIEAAYQEDVAFKKQEELIREEEEAWLAEKRGVDKEKKSKKKQKRRKGKDKTRDNKTTNKTEQNRPGESDMILEPESVPEKLDAIDDVSEASDSVDCDREALLPDSESREVSPTSWDTDTSDVHTHTDTSSSGGINGLSDNASFTYSYVSVPSAFTSSSHFYINAKSPNRLKNHQRQVSPEMSELVSKDPANKPSEHTVVEAMHDTNKPWSQVASRSLQDRIVKKPEHNVDEKVETCSSHINSKSSIITHTETPKATNAPSLAQSPLKSVRSIVQTVLPTKVNTMSNPTTVNKNPSSDDPNQADMTSILENSSQQPAGLKPESNNMATLKSNEKSSEPRLPLVRTEKLQMQHPLVMSRPSSAPSVPVPKPAISSISVVQATPIRSRSVNANGRLGLEQTAPASHSYIPQSYRNAITGGSVPPSSSTYSQNYPSMGFATHSLASSSHISPAQVDPNPMKPNLSVGIVYHRDDDDSSKNNMLLNRSSLADWAQRDRTQSLPSDLTSVVIDDDTQRLDLYNQVSTSGPAYDFPHLDIINDLLDDEHGVGKMVRANPGYQNGLKGPNHLNRLNSFPSDSGSTIGPNPLGSTSCRYERSWSYGKDASQRGYGSLVNSYDVRPAHVGPRPYVNGVRVDGYVPNLWQVSGSDSSPLIRVGSVENDGYPYRVEEYSIGVNGYEVVRPWNGF